jgi:hypothetical protein
MTAITTNNSISVKPLALTSDDGRLFLFASMRVTSSRDTVRLAWRPVLFHLRRQRFVKTPGRLQQCRQQKGDLFRLPNLS